MSLLTLSSKASDLQVKLQAFVQEKCVPAETEFDEHISKLSGEDRWSEGAVPQVINRLKEEAKRIGLWNLFLPHPLPAHLPRELSPSLYLSNREYGILCETMGRSFLAPEACNCSAPDTGNMEVLLKFGTENQQRRWLVPLLDGTIRSAFLMSEPDVASSDATNIEARLTKLCGADEKVTYVLNGKKWWSTGAMDPRCKFVLVLARMDYSHPSCSKDRVELSEKLKKSRKHSDHTVVLVPIDKPGVRLVRPLTVFGYDDAPHGHAEVHLDDVQLDASSIVLGEGRGFEIAQSRLGPGRVHHCMRAVGQAARCFEHMMKRTLERETFRKPLWKHGMTQEMIADSAADLEVARLLTLSCAADIDEKGAKDARDKIAMIKFAVPELTFRVVDRAVQVFGGAGVSGDLPLARLLAGLRTLRIADGPDAVHKRTLALLEVKKTLGRLSTSRL